MKNISLKKLLLPNLPYVFIALLATKLGQAVRLAPGADFSAKVLHITIIREGLLKIVPVPVLIAVFVIRYVRRGGDEYAGDFLRT